MNNFQSININHLTINGVSLSDISAISNLKNLKKLDFEGQNGIDVNNKGSLDWGLGMLQGDPYFCNGVFRIPFEFLKQSPWGFICLGSLFRHHHF